MDFSTNRASDNSNSAVPPVEAAASGLQPEFRPMPRCASGPFNPGSKQCEGPKLNLSPISELDRAVIERTAQSIAMPDKIKSSPILDLSNQQTDSNTRDFRFNLNIVPRVAPDLDLRQRLDRVITVDLNFQGQPAEMSLNTRKCHLNARTGICFRMKF